MTSKLTPRPVVLDAGALIAAERGVEAARALARGARLGGKPILIPASALAQVWRDPSRQVWLSTILNDAEIVPLDRIAARGIGRLLKITQTSDVVDAHVALVAAMHEGVIVTSDPVDLRRLCPTQPVIGI